MELVTALERNLQKFLSFFAKNCKYLIKLFGNQNKSITFVMSDSNNAHTYEG